MPERSRKSPAGSDPNGWVKFGLRIVKLCLMFYAMLFLLLLVEMLAWIRRGIDRVV